MSVSSETTFEIIFTNHAGVDYPYRGGPDKIQPEEAFQAYMDYLERTVPKATYKLIRSTVHTTTVVERQI